MRYSSGQINWQWLIETGRIKEATSGDDYIVVGSLRRNNKSKRNVIYSEYMIKVSDFLLITGDGPNESYTESGTRAGLDLFVGIGDYDDSGDGTKITIDDNNGEIIINGQALFPNGDIVLSNGGGLKLDATGFVGTLLASNLTGTRDFEVPDESGTLALEDKAYQAEMSFAASDQTTPLVVATNIAGMFAEFDMTLESLFAGVGVLGTTSGGTRIQIQKNGVDMLSTPITIDHGDTTSLTATTPPVISVSSITRGDRISVDIQDITGGGTEAGLQIVLNGVRA